MNYYNCTEGSKSRQMISAKEIGHHNFITNTDRKSLYAQIKDLVKTAQGVALSELVQRREILQRMLEYEDKIYEEEFANKVKSRIDEDIKMRKDVLLKIKEERAKQSLEFLEKKRVQQQMESCYEIREALRRKDTIDVKETQLEQITEKERALVRERQLDEYWSKMRDVGFERYDKRQEKEDYLRREMKRHTRCLLDMQKEELERRREEDREVKRQEAKQLDELMHVMRLEEMRKANGPPPEQLAYRQELLDMIAESKQRREAEEHQRAEEHRELIRTLQRLEAEESAALLARKRASHKATIEYIDYVRRMRKLEADAQKMRDDRIDDLMHVDICTKSNIAAETKRRAEIAALCYAELRRQICEEYERRAREELERREQKIIENRFARSEKTREDVMAERRKLREGLDEQLAELGKIRAAQEAEYNNDLQLAINDSEFCTQLAEKYVREGIDYLPPHANWHILACPRKEFVCKPRVALEDVPPEGRSQSCIRPCGCEARTENNCTLKRYTPPTDAANRGDC